MSVVAFATRVAGPWAHLYGASKLLSTTVTFVHVGGMLLGGGFAIAADRATLRVSRHSARRRAHLDELHAIHRPVLLGLALTFASGMLLLASDVETLLPAPLFWIKMGVVAALLANGARLQRAETALRHGRGDPDRAWRRLRGAALLSLSLWFGSVLLGTGLLAV
ncbi:MAG TPA: hypothetical protein VL241_11875 [Gemmatimonadales bacterium]|nr:hypothetical protein [Gemmatimonadales bacterium]